MNIFDRVMNSGLPLVQTNINCFSVGGKSWKYDPNIEFLVPEGYKEPWAREVIKMLKPKIHG